LYKSASEASRITGISKTCITDVAEKKENVQVDFFGSTSGIKGGLENRLFY